MKFIVWFAIILFFQKCQKSNRTSFRRSHMRIYFRLYFREIDKQNISQCMIFFPSIEQNCQNINLCFVTLRVNPKVLFISVIFGISHIFLIVYFNRFLFAAFLGVTFFKGSVKDWKIGYPPEIPFDGYVSDWQTSVFKVPKLANLQS